MRNVAVFDLDGTILKGTSAEHQLSMHLLKRGIVTPFHMSVFFLECLRLLALGRRNDLRKNKFHLRRVSCSRVLDIIPDVCRTRLKPHFSPHVINRFHELKRQGFWTIILSGTPTFILDGLHEILPFDQGIGSEFEVNNSTFTGYVTGIYPWHVGKVDALQKHCGTMDIDYSQSCSFANKFSDIPLLEIFGYPVAVHPDARLRNHARSHGWDIIE